MAWTPGIVVALGDGESHEIRTDAQALGDDVDSLYRLVGSTDPFRAVFASGGVSSCLQQKQQPTVFGIQVAARPGSVQILINPFCIELCHITRFHRRLPRNECWCPCIRQADDMPKNRDVRQRGGWTREGEGSKELYRSASGRQREQQANKGRNRRGREGEIKPIWNGGTRGLGEIYKPGGCDRKFIPFSAFWLRSSVVSVLISLISDTRLIEPHDMNLIFLGGGPVR